MSAHYSIDGADGTDPLLVITTQERATLHRRVVTHEAEGSALQEGVSMYYAPERKLYLVSKWVRTGDTMFIHWNNTKSESEANAMFDDLERIARSEGVV
jgi:hypothetical protein